MSARSLLGEYIGFEFLMVFSVHIVLIVWCFLIGLGSDDQKLSLPSVICSADTEGVTYMNFSIHKSNLFRKINLQMVKIVVILSNWSIGQY